MSIAAGLCSYLVVTREARLGLNGPQVIEQEAGIAEYDSRDRPFIWSFTGGEQRARTGLADAFVDDDAQALRDAVIALLRARPSGESSAAMPTPLPRSPVALRPDACRSRRRSSAALFEQGAACMSNESRAAAPPGWPR